MRKTVAVLLLLALCLSLLCIGGASANFIWGSWYWPSPTLTYDDNGRTVSIEEDTYFAVQLPENYPMGYRWDLTTSDGLAISSSKYDGSGTHEWVIKATKLRSQKITGVYNHQTFWWPLDAIFILFRSPDYSLTIYVSPNTSLW